ncbi:MAG TPA: hypothetical protein VIK93_04145 [Limnochordales bacterium]
MTGRLGAEPVLVIFEGGPAASDPERMLQDVRSAIVLEHIEKAQAAGTFGAVIVCTDRPELAQAAAALGAQAELDAPDAAFHFGRRLQRLVRERSLEAVCCMGGAAGPLMTVEELAGIGRLLAAGAPVVAANNIYSADIVAFAPAQAILAIEPPPIDNTLATALHHGAGLPLVALPRSLGLHLDVDTPTDLLVLAVHPATGPRVRARLAAWRLDVDRVQRAKAALVDPHVDVFLYGRINAPLFTYLDQHSRCRIRLLSEERGMKALGRDARGEVRAILGYALEALGAAGLFRCLETLCSAAFLDTRVLLAHARRQVSTADRFYSDLGRPERIEDPWLAELTAAAVASRIPVILGGHGLVSGGVWALLDAALQESPAGTGMD